MIPVIVNRSRLLRRVRLADLLIGERSFADCRKTCGSPARLPQGNQGAILEIV